MSVHGPAVILVHGFLDSGTIWSPVMDTLDEAFVAQCTTTDLAGMGMAWAAEGPFTLPRYAEDTAALIDRVKGPVVLVGHSMGAQIVELAAARRPQRVAGLFLLSPVPLGGAKAPPAVTDPLAATGGDIKAQREVRWQLMGQPPDPGVLEFLTGLGGKVKREVTEALVKAWNEGLPEGRSPSAFQGPVLVATGDEDTFATIAMATEIAARFRDCSRTAVKGAGHWPQAERPESVAKIISDFIASVPERVHRNLPTG